MPNETNRYRELELSASKFAARWIEPFAAELDHTGPAFPTQAFAAGIEAGFDRLLLPESAGGSGFELSDFCALIRTLAQTCAGHAMVFGVHIALVKSLSELATENSRVLLERVLASGRPVGIALPDMISLDRIETELKIDPAAKISGPAGLAINLAPNGFIIAFAQNDKGVPAALMIESDAKDLLAGPELAIGLRAMPAAELKLEGKSIGRANIVCESEQALKLFRSIIVNVCFAVSASSLGTMEKASQKAFAYANERYQGSRMIIDHSHLKNILGAISAKAAAGRGAVFNAASDPADFLSALQTKVRVTDSAVQVCADAVQILGGYGYMREYGLEKMMRDSALLSLLPLSNARAELAIADAEKKKLG